MSIMLHEQSNTGVYIYTQSHFSKRKNIYVYQIYTYLCGHGKREHAQLPIIAGWVQRLVMVHFFITFIILYTHQTYIVKKILKWENTQMKKLWPLAIREALFI